MSTSSCSLLTGLGLAGAVLPGRVRAVAGLRPGRRAELRPRPVPVGRGLRHLVGGRQPARRRHRAGASCSPSRSAWRPVRRWPPLVELVLIRPLYRRTIEQVLVTVGLSLAGVALLQAVLGRRRPAVPASGVDPAGDPASPARAIPNVEPAAHRGAGARAGWRCSPSCATPGIGLVIRAGVEDRAMVTALGIDVRKAFTLVFAIGGAAAALAGALAGVAFGAVSPASGTSLLIFGVHRRRHRRHGFGHRLGGRRPSAVGLLQQFVNYYAPRAGRHLRRRAARRGAAGAPAGAGQRPGEGDRMIRRLLAGGGAGACWRCCRTRPCGSRACSTAR